MLRKIVSVGGLTLVSRVLGFIRDVLTASVLGAGPINDAFVVAFRLPNHFRSLFAEGAFNAAFVPMFSGLLAEQGRAAAERFAERILAILVASQIVLLVVFMAVMPWFMHVFAPGFAADPAKFDLAVRFTRITFPYLLFIALVSLMGGMLNSIGRFAAAAAAPIVLNLCLIAALVGLTPFLPTAGHALAWGVLAAGAAQFAYLMIDCRLAGMRLAMPWPRLTPEVRLFLKRLAPVALGAGAVQLNLFFDTLIASLLPTGAVSYLYYADRVNQLPLGVIGIAIGTVLLPELTRRLKQGDAAGAADRQNRSIELSLLLTLPAAAAFVVAAYPIIVALFQHGTFGAADAAASAAALVAYACGLPAFVLVRSLLPGFYARGDTRLPVKVALVAVAVNVGLKLVLFGWAGYVGLAAATSAAGWTNAGLLAWLLRRRGFLSIDARLRRSLPRIVLATAFMAVALLPVEGALGNWLAAPSPMLRTAGLALLIAAGLLAFGAAAAATGLLALIRRPPAGIAPPTPAQAEQVRGSGP